MKVEISWQVEQMLLVLKMTGMAKIEEKRLLEVYKTSLLKNTIQIIEIAEKYKGLITPKEPEGIPILKDQLCVCFVLYFDTAENLQKFINELENLKGGILL